MHTSSPAIQRMAQQNAFSQRSGTRLETLDRADVHAHLLTQDLSIENEPAETTVNVETQGGCAPKLTKACPYEFG